MGHKYPDMDALGAAVATKIFANMNDKEAFIVYDDKQLLPDVERAIAKLNESEDGFAYYPDGHCARTGENQTRFWLLV